jgi:hypothetical protein
VVVADEPTSSRVSITLEAKTVRKPRLSHHKSRRRKRIAVRPVLILSALFGVWAVSDFAYHAYAKSSCYSLNSDYEMVLREPVSDDCGVESALGDEPYRRDATTAVVAVVFLIGSTVISQRMKRGHREQNDRALLDSQLMGRYLGRWPFLANKLGMVDAPRRGGEAEGAETNTIRRRVRRRMKIAARIALALGLVIGGLAVSDFAYNAYERSDCFAEDADPLESSTRRIVASGHCEAEETERLDDLMQWDAAAAVIAVVFLITSTAISRRIKRHRR